MNKEQRALASDIQNQLDDEFRNRPWYGESDIALLLFVTSSQNREGVDCMQVEDAVHVNGTSFDLGGMKEFEAGYDGDIQAAINSCTKEINAYLMGQLSQGRVWTLSVIDVGAIQLVTWNDVDTVLVIDPYTGVPFSVDLESKRVYTSAMMVVIEPVQDKQKVLIQNSEV